MLYIVHGRHLQTVEEPHLRSKWQACKKALLQESHLVREVNKERDSFAAARPAAAPPRGLENTPVSGTNILLRACARHTGRFCIILALEACHCLCMNWASYRGIQ